MQVEDLRRWYQTWYAPNNAIVVVVGDVQPEKVHQWAEQYFGALPASTIPKLKPQPEVPSLGTRIVNVSLPAKLPYLMMGYNVPVVTTAKEKWQPYALSVLAAILDGGESSRFEKDLVRGKQIATQMNVTYMPYFRLDTVFEIDAVPASGHSVEQLQSAITAEIQQLQQQPPTEAELDRAKAQFLASKIYQEDAISYQAFELGSLTAIGLSWREIDNAVQEIKKITPVQVQAVAKQYLLANNLTVGILHPLPMTKEQAQRQQNSAAASKTLH
jgi:zinc protease